MEENVPHGSLCCFCLTSLEDEALYGKMYKLEEIITHYFCVLLSAKVQQRGNDDEGILGFLAEDIRTEIRRGQSVNCNYCRKPGATIGCFAKKCTAKFHLPCGRQRDTFHQFFGQFKSFCPRHRKLQYIKKEVLIAMSGKESTCAICFDSVPASPSPKTIWAPCCSKEAWFHRICIQRLAISAGYFFKCPLCNNSDRFVESMRNSGIWVPDQDASWELETGRYEGLLQRHNSCDAKICRCRHGRTFQMENTKWEILLCGDCGSAGIHVHCGNLRIRQNWFCDVCASVHTSKKQQRKRRTKSPICQEEHFKREERTALCIRLDEQENCNVRQEHTGKEIQQEKVPKKRNSDNIQDSASNARESSFSSNDQKSSSRRTHSSQTDPDNDDSTVEIIDVEGDSSCEDSDDEVQLWRTKEPDPFTCTCKSNWRQDWSSNVQCPYRSSYSSCCCEWDEMYLYKSSSHSISGPENSLLSRFFSLVSKPGTSMEKGTYNMRTIHLPCGNGIEKCLESMRSSQAVPISNIEKNGKLGGGQKYQKRSRSLTSSQCPYYLRSFKGKKERGMIQYFDEPKSTKETSSKSQDIYLRKISQGTQSEPGSIISENCCSRQTRFESKRSSSANNEHPNSLKRRSPDPRSSFCRRYRRESRSPKRYSNCYGCSCSSREKCNIANHKISNQVMDLSALAQSPAFQPVVKLRRALVEGGRSRREQYNNRTFRRSPIRTRSRSKHECKRARSYNCSNVAKKRCGHREKYNSRIFRRSPIRTRSRSKHESERACSNSYSDVAEQSCGHREKYNSRTVRCSPKRRSRSKQESERACSYYCSCVAEQWCGPQSSPSRNSATDSSISGEADEIGWEDDVTEDTLLNIMKNVEVCFVPSSDKTLEKSLLSTKEGSVDFQSQSSLSCDDTSMPVSASDVSVNTVPTSSQLMSSPSSPLLSCSGSLKEQDCSSKSSLHAEIANHDHSYSIPHMNF